MKDELNGKNIIDFVALKPKTYSCLIDASEENKKAKQIKKCVMKQKLKFKSYESFLQSNQLENKTNHLENYIEVDSPRENHMEFIKYNKIILKLHQRIRNEKDNILTEKINKIALSLSFIELHLTKLHIINRL